MKRREFMFVALAFSLGSLIAEKAHALTWAAANKLGYKEISPKASSGQQCSTCKWYTPDPKVAGAGVCKLVGIVKANGGGEIHVKGGAICTMWIKKV